MIAILPSVDDNLGVSLRSPQHMQAEHIDASPGDLIHQIGRNLTVHSAEVVLILDRPERTRRFSVITFRGLAGHALREHAPDICDTLFKPESSGHTIPAYLFHGMPLLRHTETHLRIRVSSWDPQSVFIPALQSALSHMRGRSFGESGASIKAVEWDVIRRERFNYFPRDVSPMSIVFATPLQLRIAKRNVRVEEMTMGHLVMTTISRINSLSSLYGNGLCLPSAPFMQDAAYCREIQRNLKFIREVRHSSTQDQRIFLHGIVGQLTYTNVPRPLGDLLKLASYFHLGRHTTAGCGSIVIK